MESRIVPATRPSTCKTGNSISILSNFFKFTPKSSNSQLYRYSLAYSPEISSSISKQRERILFKSKSTITEHIGKFVFANTLLFSSQSSNEFSCTSTYDNTEYTITVTPAGLIESAQETIHFYNKFFNSIQGLLKLIMIGRKFYNPERPINLPNHKLEVWPGYASSVGYYEQGCLVNVDISHRVLRTTTVYDQICDIKKSQAQNFRSLVSRQLVGCTVMTFYNKKCYKVDEIDWDQSPLSTFKIKETESSFKEYCLTRWGKSLQFDDQPLLRSKVKNVDCFLVPECCVVTGLTDELRSDFAVMRDLATATKKEPQERLKESAALVKSLQQGKSREEIEKWQVTIDEHPVQLNAHVLPAGDILMGDNQKFKINDQTGSFERDIQRTMFSQPRLDKWGIFYCERDEKLVEQSLMSNLALVIKSFNANIDRPAKFSVGSENWNDWDRVLRSKLNPTVKIIVCVLPGSRGKSKLYDDLKRLTFSTFPVPTQVILTGTLRKDKGIRSVINKVLIQINAKVGGIPWSLAGLPFGNRGPCMVVGIDLFSQKNAPGVLGFCASTDKNFARFASFPKVVPTPGDLVPALRSAAQEALTQFVNDNKVGPSVVVVFRDGISDSQSKLVLLEEVPALKSAFASHRKTCPSFAEPLLIYTLVNKRTNARFVMENSNSTVSNPPLGTVVDSKVVDKAGYDFYILPAKANQGSMTPTYFNVIYDNSNFPCDEIQLLAYKMCFSYYNWSGSIRVPAPCQYAHKLAYMYGERSDKSGPPRPHEAWSNTRSLYYL